MIISNTLKKIFTSQVPKIFKSNIRKNHNINNINNKKKLIIIDIMSLIFIFSFFMGNNKKV